MLENLQQKSLYFKFALDKYLNDCQLHCRVVKQADTPPCLGGGESGKTGNG
jgi:hypothetical protein